jgi:hypothetical protein
MRILALFLILIALPAAAHEFWIEPVDYQPGADQIITADLVNGQNFSGSRLLFIPDWFHIFALIRADQVVPVKSRTGDRPALQQTNLGDGLHIAIYQSEPDTINYKTFEKFQIFADHKDFKNALQRHRARNLPETNFTESYIRYSKSLIGVGGGAGRDRRVGLATEFVSLENPYTTGPMDEFLVKLFDGHDVRPNTQVELFEKSDEGVVTVTLHRTDANGIARLPVKPGYTYMADAVILREPSAELAAKSSAVWETLWANLTFKIPE